MIFIAPVFVNDLALAVCFFNDLHKFLNNNEGINTDFKKNKKGQYLLTITKNLNMQHASP